MVQSRILHLVGKSHVTTVYINTGKKGAKKATLQQMETQWTVFGTNLDSERKLNISGGVNRMKVKTSCTTKSKTGF